MGTHPTKLEGFETLKDAADAVENMRYDALAEFLLHLKDALERRAISDKAAGRVHLADSLRTTARHLLSACSEMHSAWSICKRYMK